VIIIGCRGKKPERPKSNRIFIYYNTEYASFPGNTASQNYGLTSDTEHGYKTNYAPDLANSNFLLPFTTRKQWVVFTS
jgi:hypothetical protein